jgi:hypothetical protein
MKYLDLIIHKLFNQKNGDFNLSYVCLLSLILCTTPVFAECDTSATSGNYIYIQLENFEPGIKESFSIICQTENAEDYENVLNGALNNNYDNSVKIGEIYVIDLEDIIGSYYKQGFCYVEGMNELLRVINDFGIDKLYNGLTVTQRRGFITIKFSFVHLKIEYIDISDLGLSKNIIDLMTYFNLHADEKIRVYMPYKIDNID